MTRLRSLLVAILVFALLWWFLRGTDLHEVANSVRRANPWLLLASFVCVSLTYVARAIRWRYLLLPIGPTRLSTAFRWTVIGFAALSVLPARIGDLIRPYMLAKQEGLSATAAFATVVMERILDLMIVVLLLATYIWVFADPSAIPVSMKASAAVASLGTAVMLGIMWLLASHPEQIGRLVLWTGRVFPKRLAEKLAELASLFSSGFAASRSPRAMLMATLWSLPIWLAIAAEAWFVTIAFGIPMPFAGSFLIQAFLVIGVAVPTPGGVGSYHAAYRYAVTTFFGAPESEAVAAAIVLHAISFFPIVVAGAIFMAQEGLSIGGLRQLATEAREKEMVKP
jgi:uncharacterized protein (TIRG00374 family)